MYAARHTPPAIKEMNKRHVTTHMNARPELGSDTGICLCHNISFVVHIWWIWGVNDIGLAYDEKGSKWRWIFVLFVCPNVLIFLVLLQQWSLKMGYVFFFQMMVVDMFKSLLTWKDLILGQTYMPRKRMGNVFHLWLSKLGFELIDLIIFAANSHWIILLNKKKKITRFFIGVILPPKIHKV
jgi:hypothetical protein